ncbi:MULTISPECIES: exodeoxyribonuclease VII small subunit [unclassified Oscillibacter]|uniref:exodeoxyribonuclease VII small subunit n=1 Tax=unclassified Oscillibacter TaxID=2629304 RepID=UPI0025F0E9D0|nr:MULTISPECIES: exodeoxyribonuclease VII small subunit [unclassified Oscillibacter]
MAGKKKEEPQTFEQQIARLEEIVARMEKGDAELADSLALFDEGTGLIHSCGKLLDEAEQKVVRLMKGADGAPVELPFDTEDESDG